MSEREFGIPMSCVDARGRTHRPIRGGGRMSSMPPPEQAPRAKAAPHARAAIVCAREPHAPQRDPGRARLGRRPCGRGRSGPPTLFRAGQRVVSPFQSAARLSALPVPHAADGLPSPAAVSQGPMPLSGDVAWAAQDWHDLHRTLEIARSLRATAANGPLPGLRKPIGPGD